MLFSVLREHLLRNPLQNKEHIEQLAAFLAVDEDHKLELILTLAGPGAVEEAGVSSEMQIVLGTLMRGTWFSMDVHCQRLQETQSGTVPGSPLADLLYQYVQARCLRKAQNALSKEGLTAKAQIEGAEAPIPGWADDLALLLPVGDACTVVANLQRVTQVIASDRCTFELQSREDRGHACGEWARKPAGEKNFVRLH